MSDEWFWYVSPPNFDTEELEAALNDCDIEKAIEIVNKYEEI